VSYCFGEFELDPDRGLIRSGEPVPLEPQAFELLRYLIENRGRIVSRDELNEKLWQGRIVSDAALSTQIRSVRRALGDDRSHQSFIRTLPKRGFRFVAELDDGEADADLPGRPRIGRREVLGIIAAALLVLLAGIAAYWLTRPDPAETPDTPPRLSLAVLPFSNLSSDREQDYLADAFTEDLITDLSRIRDLFVMSRSTMFTFRGRQVSAEAVARELGVRYVLEGSVRIDGDTVRINAQLIDGETGAHLWSDRYDPPLDKLFSVQDSVTGRIASVLRAELRSAENRRHGPESLRDAWTMALRGNVILYNHSGPDDFREAFRLLSDAIARDPSISQAWSGLAFVHYAASQMRIPEVSRPDSARLSLEAALKAAALDPANAEAYWMIGAGYARIGQPERGMTACETAMRLNPNMDCGYVCAGLVRMAEGRAEEAVPNFRYALRLNPLFRPFVKQKYLGLAYLQFGAYDAAIEVLNRALAAAPEDRIATLTLISALALDGRVGEATDMLGKFRAASSGPPTTLAGLDRGLGWIGPGFERLQEGLRLAGMQ